MSDATAAFVRFSIAVASMLPFIDFKEKEVLFAGEVTVGFSSRFYPCCLFLQLQRLSAEFKQIRAHWGLMFAPITPLVTVVHELVAVTRYSKVRPHSPTVKLIIYCC